MLWMNIDKVFDQLDFCRKESKKFLQWISPHFTLECVEGSVHLFPVSLFSSCPHLNNSDFKRASSKMDAKWTCSTDGNFTKALVCAFQLKAQQLPHVTQLIIQPLEEMQAGVCITPRNSSGIYFLCNSRITKNQQQHGLGEVVETLTVNKSLGGG